MALQVAFSLVQWPWWLEYPMALGTGFALMFGSYILIVRGRWIGNLLNGKRAMPRAAKANNLSAALSHSASDTQ